jgi:endoglucanase
MFIAGRRHLLHAAAALGLGCAQGCAAAPAQPAAKLRPLRGADFRNSQLRGVGFGQLGQGVRSAADFDAVVALGANHVRIFIEAHREPVGELYGISSQQLQALDQTLVELEQRGLYLVLVASFGPDARGPLFESSRLQTSAVQLWQQLAQRLAGRAVVAGFDIVNEPVPPGLTYAIRQERWLAFASRVVQAVRAVDAERVLVIESAPDATPESFGNLRPLPFADLVYSLHSYHPFNFTHQTVMKEYPQPRAYPETGADGKSSAAALVESLQATARFAREHQAAIYVGEFSAVRWAPDASAARYVADSIAQFVRHGWSWSYHEFRAWHGWDPEIASSQREGGPRRADAPVLRALRAGMAGAMRQPAGR